TVTGRPSLCTAFLPNGSAPHCGAALVRSFMEVCSTLILRFGSHRQRAVGALRPAQKELVGVTGRSIDAKAAQCRQLLFECGVANPQFGDVGVGVLQRGPVLDDALALPVENAPDEVGGVALLVCQ